MVKLTQLVWNSYGLDATTHHVLLYLSDSCNAQQNAALWDKAKVGTVTRSIPVIAFRCGISKWTVSQCLNKLRAEGIIKTTKKGPHSFLKFMIFGKILETRKVTWKAFNDPEIKKLQEIIRSEETTKMDIAEEELMISDESEGDTGEMTDPTGDTEQLLAEPITDPYKANSWNSVVQPLAQHRSTLAQPIADARKPIAEFGVANSWNLENLAEDVDFGGDTENTENTIRLSLSGLDPVRLGDAGASTEARRAVGGIPTIKTNSTAKSKTTSTPQTSGTTVPEPQSETSRPETHGRLKRDSQRPPVPSPPVKKCVMCGGPAEEGRICNRCRSGPVIVTPKPKPYTGPRCPACREPRGSCNVNCTFGIEDGLL